MYVCGDLGDWVFWGLGGVGGPAIAATPACPANHQGIIWRPRDTNRGPPGFAIFCCSRPHYTCCRAVQVSACPCVRVSACPCVRATRSFARVFVCVWLAEVKTYLRDVKVLLALISDGPSKSWCFKRLRYLQTKFEMHRMLNETEELGVYSSLH